MSEAAKPADPERALAELEQLVADARKQASLRDNGLVNMAEDSIARLGIAAAGSTGWLLPLARAGLYAKAIEVREINEVLAGSAALERYATLLREAEAERDALRAEFAACVRALASIREAHRRDPMLCVGLDAVTGAQQALSGPLAAAVLRPQGGNDATNAQQGVKREPAPRRKRARQRMRKPKKR